MNFHRGDSVCSNRVRVRRDVLERELLQGLQSKVLREEVIDNVLDQKGFFENPVINEMIAHAAFESAHSVFEFGCGTGILSRLLQQIVLGRWLRRDRHQYHYGLARAGAFETVVRSRTRLSD